MNQYFRRTIELLETDNESIKDLQRRTGAIKDPVNAKTLWEELKLHIDICLDTRCKDELPFYFLLTAYCYLFTDRLKEAENYNIRAIDNFRVCGMHWNEAVGHWHLGLIYRTERRGYSYLTELDKALSIIDPISTEYLIQGKYDASKKCEQIRAEMETQKTLAVTMGTGPLHTPDEQKQEPESRKANDYIVVPWIPIYQSVRAGPKGVVWVDPPPEKLATVNEIELDNIPYSMFAIKNTTFNDHQITLTKGFEYGWTKVIGHSMSGAHPTPINQGDYVLFYKNQQPDDNDIVIASWPMAPENLAYMVKRFKMKEKLLISEPDDSARTSDYSPINISEDHQILGIVIAVAKLLNSTTRSMSQNAWDDSSTSREQTLR